MKMYKILKPTTKQTELNTTQLDIHVHELRYCTVLNIP